MLDYKKYQQSIADELIATKDRVRDLIGDASWLEDGRYKETLLIDVLRRALPDIAKIGTGFVVGDDGEMTTQIDIIVYDGRHAPIFQKDNFVIVPKSAVLGIIEVKTKLYRGESTAEIIRKASANGKIVMRLPGRTVNGTICYGRNGGDKHAGVFCGIFAFESEQCYDSGNIMEALTQSGGFVNHIAFGKDIFAKYWNNNLHNQFQHNAGKGDRKRLPFCRFYRINGLAFGYFISNLVESIHIKVLNRYPEGDDYLFPLSEGKNAYKIDGADIEINTDEFTDEFLVLEDSHICSKCENRMTVCGNTKKRLCDECS